MLSPYRVLDLCDDRGDLGGMLLAQLGAEVIAVEPPEGHRSRRQHGGLPHRAYNRGKASVVVAARDELADLAATADVVLECGAVPVDVAALRQRDPRLVTVSITPFGATGPKASWRATDLVVDAASGHLYLQGDRDRAPVRIGVPQAWRHAGADAACAALIALHERERSGLGQHADVSAQQSMMVATQFAMMYALVGRDAPRRLAGGMELGPFTLRFVHECADGHVTVTFLFGPMMGPYSARLFQWIAEEGGCGPDLSEKNWIDFGMAVFTGQEPASELDRATATIGGFVRTKTKAQLLAAALERKLMIAPITTTRDVLALDQLAFRGYWDEVDGVRYPGPFAHLAARPLRRLGAAPGLGADTERLLRAPSGASGARVVTTPTSPSDGAAGTAGALPLEGVRVLDFMWALAGPGATRMLADHGATVVRVESQRRPDVLRGVNPFVGAEGDQEGSLQWHTPNSGKMSLGLDLSNPAARDVVFDLVRWADVVTESFSPGTLARLGFGYDVLREINPQLVMLSSCLLGQDGPMHQFAGLGTVAAGIAGFYSVTGWPDRLPSGPYAAYTDYISPRYTFATILGALEWRRRTGEGQFIDFAQMEAALHLLSAALVDDQVNGVVAGRSGNDDPDMAPHGVYPVAGEDRWVAVACEDDHQWQALCTLIGRDDLQTLGTADRLARRRQLDDVVAAWTAPRDGVEVQELLQARGVPAHVVATSRDCVDDPQLVHRQQFRPVPHPIHGTSWTEGSPFVLSRTPSRVAWAGPTFGQHNVDVLQGILGYDDERIAALVLALAVE